MESKYGKYIMREPHARWSSAAPLSDKATPISIRLNSNLLGNIGCDISFTGFSKPNAPAGAGYSHKHDADEYLFFIGGDPTNILDFNAEIEILLGEGINQEKHVIDTCSIVYIPKGLAHLPMIFNRVDKPFLCGHVLLSPTYEETRTD